MLDLAAVKPDIEAEIALQPQQSQNLQSLLVIQVPCQVRLRDQLFQSQRARRQGDVLHMMNQKVPWAQFNIFLCQSSSETICFCDCWAQVKTAAAPLKGRKRRSTVEAEEKHAVKTPIGSLATQRDFHLAHMMTMVIAWLHSGGWAWQICFFPFSWF